MPEVSDRAIQMMYAMRKEYLAWRIHDSHFRDDKQVLVSDSNREPTALLEPARMFHRFPMSSRKEAEDWITARSIQVALDQTQGHVA